MDKISRNVDHLIFEILVRQVRELMDEIHQMEMELYPSRSRMHKCGLDKDQDFQSDEKQQLYEHSSGTSSDVLDTTPKNCYKDQFIQTDYDLGFEIWYRNMYEKLTESDEYFQTSRSSNNRKEVRTLFVRDKIQEPKKVQNSSKSKKSILTRKKKEPEKRTSSTSFEYSQSSRHEYHYHKPMRDGPCWVNLNIFERSSPRENRESVRDSKESLVKRNFLDSMDFPQFEIKIVKSIFDQIAIENNLDHVSQHFNEKIRNNKLKENMLNLPTNRITKNLKLLNDVIFSYDTTDEILEDMVNQWNDLKIDTVTSKAVPMNIHFDKDYSINNKINYNQCKVFIHSKNLKLLPPSNGFDQIFHVYYEKKGAPSSFKQRTWTNVTNKPQTNSAYRKRKVFLDNATLYAEYDKKVKDFTKNFGEIQPIVMSLGNNKLDNQSQRDIINAMISDVVCPEVSKPNTFEPCVQWTSQFADHIKATSKPLDFKIGFKFNTCASQFFDHCKRGETISKSRRLVAHRSTNQNGDGTNSYFNNLNKENPFNIAVFNFINEITVKQEIQEITQYLKGICMDRESLHKTLKSYLKLKFDVSNIIISFDINFAAITISDLRHSVPCLQLQQNSENLMKYELRNMVNIYLSEHFHCKQYVNMDERSFNSILKGSSIFKMEREVLYTLRSSLELCPSLITTNTPSWSVDGNLPNSSIKSEEEEVYDDWEDDLEAPSISSPKEDSKIMYEKLTFAVQENDTHSEKKLGYSHKNNNCKNCTNAQKIPTRKKLGRYSMNYEYLDANCSVHRKNNIQKLGSKNITEKSSKKEAVNIKTIVYNEPVSQSTETSSDLDTVHSRGSTPQRSNGALVITHFINVKHKYKNEKYARPKIMKQEENKHRIEQEIIQSKQMKQPGGSSNDILENKSQDNHAINSNSHVSHPKKNTNSHKQGKEAEKTRKSNGALAMSEKKTDEDKTSHDDTSSIVEILHEGGGNCHGKSTSTLAMSAHSIDFRKTRRDHGPQKIEFQHERREESHDKAMSTLALAEQTIQKEKSCEKHRGKRIATSHKNHLIKEIVLPTADIDTQLSEVDSISELYNSFDSMAYSPPVGSANDLTSIDSTKSGIEYDNNAVSLTPKESLSVSLTDSILALYLQLS